MRSSRQECLTIQLLQVMKVLCTLYNMNNQHEEMRSIAKRMIPCRVQCVVCMQQLFIITESGIGCGAVLPEAEKP